MKIRVTRKKDPDDQTIVDLSHAAMVRKHPVEGLVIYSTITDINPVKLSPKEYKIEYVEVSCAGKIAYIEKDLDTILSYYILFK